MTDELKNEIGNVVYEWWNCAEHVFPSILVDKLTKFFEPREKRIAELEKENAELKAQIENDRDLPAIAYMQGAEKQKKKDTDQLTKAKELLKQLVDIEYAVNIPKEKIISLRVKAEQFLNSEVEK